MANKELILSGLRSTKLEKNIQERLINAINEKNYLLGDFLVKAYDRVCENTDEIAKKIIDDSTKNIAKK